MKRCPTCQSTYTDDSLRFCLQDGAQLVRAGEAPSSFDPDATLREDFVERNDRPPPTEILDARIAPTARMRSPAPTEVVNRRATRHGPQQNIAPAPESSMTAIKAAVIVLAVLLPIVAGLGLWLWLRSSGESNRNAAASENDRRAGNENGGAYSNRNGPTSAPPGRITATASSTRPPLAGNTYEPANALDGRLMTAWVEGVSGPGIGEWIRCDFEREVTLKRISIAPGYFKSPQIWARNNRVSAATLYFSDGTSRRFGFDDRMEEQLLEVGAIRTSWVRIVIDDVYTGTDPDTAISQLAFEWE
ncbi:MAG TPA: discoidin domain-containing protein [Pyrinomonadaceae bacterium]|nr:discoidin domain-containing protein [Pyrinomonadaceae bacterium]